MPLAIVRGGGDLATGVVYRLWKAGFSVLVLEIRYPTVIRRAVSVAQAIFDSVHTVGGMTARRIVSAGDLPGDGSIGVLVDPEGASIGVLKPDLLVDAIMAKKNCGTFKSMAPRVVALGPGFSAPEEVHAVVETLRGHDLGRVITNGTAAPDTGNPGEVGGETSGRLLRSPAEGRVSGEVLIGDRVEAGQVVCRVGGISVRSEIGGVVRGLIHSQVPAFAGMKIGDVDPRAVRENCFSISDKSLAVAGGVLEAAFMVQ